MIEHVWTVLCRTSSIDRETNNISLFEVIEQIQLAPIGQTPERAVAPIQLQIVSLWCRSDLERPSRGQARVAIRVPGGVESGTAIHELDLSQFRRLRTRSMLDRIPIAGSGLYRFIVQLRQDGQDEWSEVANMPLEITIQQTADQES